MSRVMQHAVRLVAFAVLVFICGENVRGAMIENSFFYCPDRDTVVAGKTGLLPLQLGTVANYTNVSQGIAGVRIVFDEAIIDDFSFRTGTTEDTAHWQAQPSPAQIAVQDNEATILWTSGAVTDGWLEVTYNPDNLVLYFGNLVGDTNSDALRSPIDALLIMAHIGQPVTDETAVYDINCDLAITDGDVQIVADLLQAGGIVNFVLGPFEPVPEPGAMLLFASALIGLAVCRRRLTGRR